jgi:hypothetical protein
MNYNIFCNNTLGSVAVICEEKNKKRKTETEYER